MIVWKIARKEYAGAVLSGQGGMYSSGRWHEKGTLIVYTSSTLSLAILEVFVHLGPEGHKIEHIRVQIEIPDKIKIDSIPPSEIPPDWNMSAAPWSTKNYGTQWIRSMSAAVLKTPSVISPGEFNYILNPTHPEFHKIKIINTEAHYFDGRMWEAKGRIKSK